MVSRPSIPEPHSISTYVEDGARIVGILFVWGIIGAFFAHVVSEIGGTGSLFETFGPQMGALFAMAGFLNAVLYVLYRTVDYWHQYAE